MYTAGTQRVHSGYTAGTHPVNVPPGTWIQVYIPGYLPRYLEGYLEFTDYLGYLGIYLGNWYTFNAYQKIGYLYNVGRLQHQKL